MTLSTVSVAEYFAHITRTVTISICYHKKESSSQSSLVFSHKLYKITKYINLVGKIRFIIAENFVQKCYWFL